ncbi:hypothetical protein I0C86_39545 [Plantactinospora sp. S1510]|uniref:VWFD domain-containing protein n=1 Tax=Plantactinospora alkalitolerans TaxID=2789879 RepID=A0ABS0H922_9ACTN|nr:hypothetical protein [Plantactinospora alkalitolerans]MBF9134975.1 hypothetical protein [Plantactinospora alkalitolerans]
MLWEESMMRLLPRRHRARLGLIGITTAAVLLTMAPRIGGEGEPSGTQEELKAWHSRMVEASQPSAHGCFTGAYPAVMWWETACVDPPSVPMSPKHVPAARRDVGGGISVVTERPPGAGPITHAYGTFEEVHLPQALRVDSVPPRAQPGEPPSGPVMANSYSLQLNTNYLRVEECGDSPAPAGCWGWKQFVFANDGSKQDAENPPAGPSRLYVEYWLLHYNPDTSQGQTCPTGWEEVPDDGEIHCSLKRNAGELPYVPIVNIDKESFRLEASTETVDGEVVDKVRFNNGDRNIYSASGVDILHVLPPEPGEPDPGWTQVEFNVFGYGEGSTATFNQQASFNLRTTIVDGSPAKPKCRDFGFSKERNNLNFGPPGPVATSPAPALIINESRQGPASVACAVAVAVGDTHQYTFAGTFYDFQATGDFVEARAGSTFEVQTRKESGAPNWPNTSVDKSVGVRMGNSRLAVCGGTRLVVNGANTSLPSGEALLLPTGVTIDRVNNVYTFRDPSGNSVRVTAVNGNVPYIDLGIGLGPETAAARGLLGNHNGDPHYLETSDGTPMLVPLSFVDLYQVFGNSWRVSPTATLLRPCDTVGVGNPTAPFYAGNLGTDVRQQARNFCVARGVDPLWLDTCSLDVAVLGANATTVYVGLRAPVVDANPKQLPIPCVPSTTHPTCPTPICVPGAAGCPRPGN